MSDPRPWLRYSAPGGAFSVETPPGWQVLENQVGLALLLLEPLSPAAPFRANANVTLHRPTSSVDEFLEKQLARMAEVLSDFRLNERREEELPAGTARRIDASYRQGRFDISTVQWNWSRDDDLISLSAAHSSDREDLGLLFELVAGSLAVEPSPET